MRYRLLLAGAAGVVAVLGISWAVWGHVAGGNRGGEITPAEQAAAQNGFAGQAALACADSGQTDRLGMANPAATYCQELGYEYRITQTGKGEQGVCVFPDGKECEEWKFLAGKCGQERSYCARQGFDIETKTNGKNSLSREYATCMSGGEEIGSVDDMMGLSQKATKGSIPMVGSEPDQNQAPITGTPPFSFDWRNSNGQNWMTSVKDQGSCGSCWAFSTVGVVEGAYNVQNGDPNLDLDLSEEYLVSDCYTMGAYGNCCGGSYEDAFEFVRDSGIPDEGCMPYVDRTSCSCGTSCDASCTYRTGGACSGATCSNRCANWQSRAVKINAVAPVPSGQIRQYLIDKGPLSAALGVGSGYGGSFDAQGVYRCSNDSGANHAVVVVGYNDAGGYWIIKNSWGAGWNGDGYFKVGYGECAIETWPYYIDAPAPEPTATPTPTVCPGDSDCDGVLDTVDNCPTVYNPDQKNSDGGRRPAGSKIPGGVASNPSQDKLGDVCDPDNDNDGLPDAQEFDDHCPYRLVADSDGDLVLDGFEVATGYDPCNAASKPTWGGGGDSDGDRLLDETERRGYNTCAFAGDTTPGWATCAVSLDSDGDGCADTVEVLDLDGNRKADSGDMGLENRRVAGIIAADPVSDSVFDLDKNGKIDSGDTGLMNRSNCMLRPSQLGCPKCPAE
jgi:putative hemolysin